jgi:serine/threonine protein kinase
MRVRPGQFVGEYKIIELVGAGGMGSVYKAYHPFMNRVVALKLIRSEYNKWGLASRFRREVEVSAKLSHPNVLRAYHAGAETWARS